MNPSHGLLKRVGWERSTAIVSILILVGVLLYGPDRPVSYDNKSAVSTPSQDPVIAVAGNIACAHDSAAYNDGAGTAGACRAHMTSDLLIRRDPDAVLTLGDNALDSGTRRQFEESYGPAWGRFKEITHPVPGDREYRTRAATDYFAYFGDAAGDPTRGYYSYDIGEWHMVALNSNCPEVGGCGVESPQGRWLQGDLEDHPSQCALAYWHDSAFGPTPATQVIGFWEILYEHGADIVLNGDDHSYQRFARQDPEQTRRAITGIRQFVVGTGGESLEKLAESPLHLQRSDSSNFGVLELTLHPTRYSWRFLPELADSTFTDLGTGPCK